VMPMSEPISGARSPANLAELIRQQGPLSEQEIVSIFASVLRDLEFAHSQAMLHKDITTARVVRVGADWKLTEYGLARVGTVRYMSPERCQGKPLDARSDIYSLGVVLYEAATGRPPFFEGLNYQIMDAQVNKPPPPPRSIRPEISAELERVILRALAKNPSGRFQSAAEFRQAIEAIRNLADQQPAVGGDHAVRSGLGPRRRTRNVLLASGIVIVVVVTVGAGAAKLGLLRSAPAVPTFAGLSREEARALAERRRIDVVFEEVDDARAEGTVIGQFPMAGTRANSRVQLQVSSGFAVVPALTGCALEEATARLRSVGLAVVRVDSEYSDVYSVGQVMAVGPKPGSRVKSGTPLKLTVSAGRATCPECGARREPGAQFCIRCGHKF
ncbi:MAG: PASTA domain-containing protein, partial [candidate division WOR-3 bacterium]